MTLEEGSCGLQGKLVLIGGLVYRKLYHLMKIERFKNMFLEHVCVFFVVCLFFCLFICFIVCPQSPYHFIFPDFKTGLDDLVCVLFRPKKRKIKKLRNYNQNFNVKFKLLVSFLSQTCENL